MKKILLVLTLLLLGSGCASINVRNAVPLDQIPEVNEVEKTYYIQVGDVLRVEIEDAKIVESEDSGYEIPVRPDGKILLPLLKREVLVAGRTVLDVQKDLLKQYARLIKRPNLLVNIIEFSPREVYVAGELRGTPSPLVYTTRLTALRAISAAGYDPLRADLQNIVVVRWQGIDKDPLVTRLRLRDAINNVDTRQDIRLMPNDVVIVAKTGVVAANDAIDQYVNRMIPLPGFVTSIAGAWVYDRYLDND